MSTGGTTNRKPLTTYLQVVRGFYLLQKTVWEPIEEPTIHYFHYIYRNKQLVLMGQ